MRNNLKAEIATYVHSKHNLWSDRTITSVNYILRTMAVDFNHPAENYKRLISRGLGRYTIKTYFMVAGKFEEQQLGKTRYKDFLKQNSSAFKNCYKEKTRRLSDDDFRKCRELYSQSNARMFNLLTLMGCAGLRVSEAMSVKWSDFFNEDGVSYLKVVGKGSKQRVIPFDMAKLQKTDSEFAVQPVAFRFFFKRDMKPFTPHDFRAYFATSVARDYVSTGQITSKDLASLLGHASTATTEKYIRADLKRVAKVFSTK